LIQIKDGDQSDMAGSVMQINYNIKCIRK
jgi:hypothetical protein